MTREEFRHRLIGRVIIGMALAEKDCLGARAAADEILIESLTLDDGTVVSFDASPQIEIRDVWASLDPGRK